MVQKDGKGATKDGEIGTLRKTPGSLVACENVDNVQNTMFKIGMHAIKKIYLTLKNEAGHSLLFINHPQLAYTFTGCGLDSHVKFPQM